VRRRGLSAVVFAVAAAVGCSGDDSGPTATLASGSTDSSVESTTSTTVGVDEVPDEITVEYVQRVMDALDASWGDMYRLYVESGGPTAETEAWMDALYAGEERERIDHGLGMEAADEFENTRMPPGDPVTTVESITSSTVDCIFFEGMRHYDEVLSGGATKDRRGSVALERANPSDRNPTAWKIVLEATTASRPGDPCGG
jgi:hypothetical protein